MKSDLSLKELQKGYDAFNKIYVETTAQLLTLEEQLLEEVRIKGHTNYSHSLSNSIQLHTQHKTNAYREMREYSEEMRRKEKADIVEDEYTTHILYSAHIMEGTPEASEVSYLAPLGTAINKFVKMVQDHSVAGYETANWVKNRLHHRSGNVNNAKHLREHPGCFIVIVRHKVILAINIKTQKIHKLDPKEWFI